jgi:hypothetical protein
MSEEEAKKMDQHLQSMDVVSDAAQSPRTRDEKLTSELFDLTHTKNRNSAQEQRFKDVQAELAELKRLGGMSE